MSDEATPITGGAAEQAAAAPTPGVDFGPVFERMEQMGSRLESSFNERLASMQPQVEPETEQDPYAGLTDYYEDPYQAQQAQQALEQVLSARLDQATKPLLQQIEELKSQHQRLNNDLELGDLEAKYPRLASDEALANSVFEEAQKIAQSLGNPALAQNARLIETAYLAHMGRARAAGETPAGGAHTGLEAAGGASPGQPEPDLAQSILRANGPSSPARELFGW